MTGIISKTQEKIERTELLDEELDNPMKLIFGMPLETHDSDGITNEDYSVTERNLPMNLPPNPIKLPVAINDSYLRYGQLCRSKIYDKRDLIELSGFVGCSTGQLEEIFIGSHPLSEKLFNKINDVLTIGPYELKHNRAKIF